MKKIFEKILKSMTKDIGIDLGTANVLVYVKDQGIVLREPSVVAIDTTTDKVVRVGREAADMLGKTPENISAIRPLKDGSISQYEVTLNMLQYFIRRACGKSVLWPRVVISVPIGISDVEERAIIDAAHDAGVSKTYLIDEPVAAAVGAGYDIKKPEGHLIVDIGGGTSQIAVISYGGTVVSECIKIGGDRFDEAIMQYARKKYNLLIGERTAENVKITVGSVYDHKETIEMNVRGRDTVGGMPKVIKMNSREMMEALLEPVTAILDAVCSVIERTPPELVGDILKNGIVMIGGGAKLRGIDKLTEKVTGIKTVTAENPDECVVIGTGRILEEMGKIPDGVINISRDRKVNY